MVNSSNKMFKFIVCSMLIVSIVVISLTCAEASQQDRKLIEILRRMEVKILNDNDYSIGVHCKSADKDIGFQTLKKGELYAWKFTINFWNTTLFFCGFTDIQGKSGVFEIYEALRDYDRCKKICNWKAEKKGLYGYSDTLQIASLFYKWLK